LDVIGNREVIVNSFGGSHSVLSRSPSENVTGYIVNSGSSKDLLNSLIVKSSIEEVNVPLVGVGVPKITESVWKRKLSDREKKVVMDGIPDVAPRGGLDRAVTLVELELNILGKFFFDLQDRRPKGRSGA